VGGRADLVKVVYDGIASGRFDQVRPEQANSIRQELGLENVPVVGLFSRLSFWKGQHILLEALRALPDVHGLLVGDVLFGEDEYVTQIKNMANEPDLQNRVHWLGFRNDVPILMAACDIIVHASTEPEPCARMAVEGQLAQKPVIATAAGGMFEIVEDGVTGRLSIPGDALSLATAIRELLADPTTAHKLAKQGRDSAQVKFSPEDCIGVVDQAIEKVMTET
jgi:glycosyltransferase involved in cell wall biosynthesis